MANDEIIPHLGIRLPGGAMMRLGMSREEALPLIGAKGSARLDFQGEVVAFIETPKHWGSFEGIELFESSADEVVAAIVRRRGLDPAVYRPGRHTYYFPNLRMILWRGTVSEVEGEQGYDFDSVSIHAAGYYDARTLASLRERSGLPAETG